MSESYDPLEVEGAIDDTYRIAENIDTYQEEVEEAIAMIEKLPYSVHEKGSYTEEDIIEASKGFNILEKLHRKTSGVPMGKFGGKTDKAASESIRYIERVIENDSYRPAMDEGDIEIDPIDE
jgi:hypothetical protein